jgi:peroxiredoxin
VESGAGVPVPENLFTLTLVYRRSPRWLDVLAAQGPTTDAERRKVAAEMREALAAHPEVTVRGVYSCAGLRADADTAVWLLSQDVARLQAAAAALRRTVFGRCCDLSWAFLGVARPPEFVGDHYAAFQLGKPPLRWLCVYPFVRQPEWYLLPPEERGRLLRAHGEMGRAFPDIQTNGVQAFGLGDWEWLLHFEAERPERFTALIRHLRGAEARRWTKEETPFIVGRRVESLEEALAELG